MNTQERKEREALAAEGGWTVVVHHKGRKKTTESESGTAVGAAHAAVTDRIAKKKNKDVGPDFYRFQKREAQRSGMLILLPIFCNYGTQGLPPCIFCMFS